MRRQSQYHWNLHGLSIHAAGSEAVVAALASRLSALPADAISSDGLDFEFQMVSERKQHLLQKPAGVSRSFYLPAVGEALYFPQDDLLYLDYQGQAICLCHPEEGRCCLSLVEPETEQLWLASHPLFTLPLLEMMKRRGMYNIHAACFALGGKGLLLAGASGAGKSTLSIALLASGLDFLGDDMVFLDRSAETQILAFPESIDVSDATIGFFPELDFVRGREKRPGWPKHELRADSFPGSQGAWRAKPTAIVFPCISHKTESWLAPMTSDDAFLELAPNVLLTESKSTRAHFEKLADLVKNVPAYRLNTGTDFGQVSELLRKLIQ